MNTKKSLECCLEKTGIKKSFLAKGLGVSIQTVSNLCKSERCSSEMIERLAEFFDMKASEFIKLGE